MEKSLLVTVFVPTTDERSTDFQGGRGNIATGYPVGPHHILTARHVLYPEPPLFRDNRYVVKVRWHYHRQHKDADQHGWIRLAHDAKAIVWPDVDALETAPGADDLDALLLHCPRPDSAVGWRELSNERPSGDMSWESEGFPLATKYDAIRNPCSFGGSCFSKAPEENFFELSAEAAPESEDDWRGASGMPIFVGRRIIGIARRVPKRFGAEKLHATPCWKLLADDGFRAALGIDERKTVLDRVRRWLCTTLDQDCTEALAEPLGANAEIAGLELRKKAEKLSDRLLETDVRDAIKALRKAHRSLEDDADADVAAPLVDIANRVIPALFDQGVVRQVQGQQQMTLIPLPAGTHTVAELIMASSDGRPACFRPREHEDHQPPGEFSLPLHPEQGIHADASAALAGHLQRKLDPGKDAVQKFRTAVDDYLLGSFFRSDPGGPSRTLKERIQLTADLLKQRRVDSGATYYLIFQPPKDPKEREPFEELVRGLKRDYKAIAFLELDPSFQQERADRALVDPLCRMLAIKPQRPGDDG